MWSISDFLGSQTPQDFLLTTLYTPDRHMKQTSLSTPRFLTYAPVATTSLHPYPIIPKANAEFFPLPILTIRPIDLSQ